MSLNSKMCDSGGGSGPGGHPGVTVVTLIGDPTGDAAQIEAQLEAGRSFLFTYTKGGSSAYAVFASKY